jgi:hypothetical protein
LKFGRWRSGHGMYALYAAWRDQTAFRSSSSYWNGIHESPYSLDTHCAISCSPMSLSFVIY